MSERTREEEFLLALYNVRESLRLFERQREEHTIDNIRLMLDMALERAAPEQLRAAEEHSVSALINKELGII